ARPREDSCSWTADPLDFPFEADVGFRLDATADFLAQRLDLGACRATEVQEEVAMLFRDLRITHREAAAAGRVDECPGLVARRILEGRTAGAASERLRLLAGPGDRVHLGADRLRVAGRPAKHGFDDDRARRDVAVTIAIAKLL